VLLGVLFPPPEGSPSDLARHRFTVTTVLVTIATTASIAPVYWHWNASLGQVLAAYCAALVGVALVLRGTRSISATFWLMEFLTALYFLFSSWTELTFDASWAMWLVILPLVGMLFGGMRYAVYGLGFALPTALAIMLLPAPDLFVRGPVTAGTVVARVSSFFLVIFVLAVTYEALRVSALHRAEAAGRARTMFLANMSHELRTPMNGVLGFTELLLNSQPRADQLDSLDLMRRSGQQLLAIINDVVDFARLDAGRMHVQQHPVALRDLVRDVVELLRPAAQHGHIALTLTIEAEVPPWIQSDGVRLRQVMTNLVGNAVKFTPAGTVDVRVSRRASQLVVAIKDTGIGISPEVQAKLFQPFQQADGSSNRRFEGSGLGLSISQQLMALLGGSIALESEPGQGSTFTMAWPCVEAPAQRSEEASSCQAPVDGALRVLLADDNEINLKLATALLAKLGLEPKVAHDGLEALEVLARQPFDVVLMDCHMPGMDGFEATRRIRALDGPASRTPIVALTASALREELDRCLAVGMNDHLTKPVSLAALANALRHFHPQARSVAAGAPGRGPTASEPPSTGAAEVPPPSRTEA
jgi:signal transduction histidine kinase/ActR/RegA family two-component response regulator